MKEKSDMNGEDDDEDDDDEGDASKYNLDSDSEEEKKEKRYGKKADLLNLRRNMVAYLLFSFGVNSNI